MTNKFTRKLTPDQVAQIHALKAQHVPQVEIARQFKITEGMVTRILNGTRHAELHPTIPSPARNPARNPLRGSSSPVAKLNDAAIGEIRRLSKEGFSQRVIADRFGVTRGAIVQILAGRTWKHIIDQSEEQDKR